MKTFGVLFGSFILGCVAAAGVEAGSCHGTKPAVQPASVVVEQDVTVSPGVVVKESVEIDGAPAGSVTVNEEVIVGGSDGGPAGGPASVGAARKDARRAKKATIAEAKAERKAFRLEKKAYDAEREAAAEGAVKRIYQ